MLAVFDEMQNDDIVAIASADTDYLTLIEFLKAKEKTVLSSDNRMDPQIDIKMTLL